MSKERIFRGCAGHGIVPRAPRRWRLLLTAVMVLAALLVAPAGLRAQGAAVPVERLHEALLTAAADGDTPEARYAHLHPVVSEVFDFRAMSRAAVGGVWFDFSDEQRTALVERFAAYATANYAKRFTSAENIAFRTVAVEPGDGKQVHVATELVRPEKGAISFDYLVFRGAEGPHIINVVVAGTLNEFARRRAEFRSLMQAGGLPHLLETLEQQKRALAG